MAFILRKPSTPCQITKLNLSGSRGALHYRVSKLMQCDPKQTFLSPILLHLLMFIGLVG